MKRIFHLGGSVLTGNDLADAVLHYAKSLAASGQTGIAEIPIVDEGGRSGRAMLLVGPGMQLTSVTSLGYGTELRDPDTVKMLLHIADDECMATARPFDKDEALFLNEFEA